MNEFIKIDTILDEKKENKLKAVEYLFPNGGYCVNGEREITDWSYEEPIPTDDEVENIINSDEYKNYINDKKNRYSDKIKRKTYEKEADFLKIEAEYDAIINGTQPDYTKWIKKVKELKQKFKEFNIEV